MKIIYNREQFVKNYPYSKDQIKAKDYPKKYPCIMTIVDVEGGLSGDYMYASLVYPGKHDFNSFVAGFKKGMKTGE